MIKSLIQFPNFSINVKASEHDTKQKIKRLGMGMCEGLSQREQK